MNKYAKLYNKLEESACENGCAVDFREDVAELVRASLEEGKDDMTLKELVLEIQKDYK